MPFEKKIKSKIFPTKILGSEPEPTVFPRPRPTNLY